MARASITPNKRLAKQGCCDQGDALQKYNHLDLPRKIISAGTTLVNYSYLADGTKISSLKEDGSGLVYRGPFVYKRDEDGALTLESAACPEGRLTPDKALLYITDHLGSVRFVIDGNTGSWLERSDYTAYGTRSGLAPLVGTGLTLRDHFTGQEDQMPDFSVPYSDHDARHYSPALRRWMVPDPLSEKYYGQSPYAYCNSNPVNFVDLDGRECDPVKNPKIRHNRASNLYGNGIRVANGNFACHQGFDYETPVGTDVFAVKDGIVVNSGATRGAYGTSICIEHKMDDGSIRYTFYAHLSETSVKVGENVKEGDTIGKTGTTGNAERMKGKDEHLHFEFRSQKGSQLGLGGKLNPNEIVPTKFKSQDPSAKPQNKVGVIKVGEDGKVTIMNID